MSEIKLAPQASVQSIDTETDSAAPGSKEIRQLSELELALAGGGDGTYDWP
jgi:hypothetical protein